jgi:hypothetical protein
MNSPVLAAATNLDPCGKRRYPDRKAAQSAINLLLRRRGRHGIPEALRSYPCPQCRGWHLTKKVRHAYVR